MNYEEELEEGRVALHQLEGQLKGTGVPPPSQQQQVFQQQQLLPQLPQRSNFQQHLQRLDGGDAGSVGSLNSARRILDQVPRDTRLHYRQGSPLGLTVEELDDRGLLDGGGSVPNYYTSSRQRSRRPLEMKKRSSRLQERGKEAPSKLISGLFHMIRTLVRKGLPIESYCRNRDANERGLMDKKSFMALLKSIGLPFVHKEMVEITSRYTVPSTDMIDYETLLKDAGALSIEMSNDGIGTDADSEGLEYSLRGIDINLYSGVLLDVKRMLLESVQSLGKQMEDVYRMFARWDNDGAGTVTATQFMRVLARLHVDLSDQDQDLVVELLDTNAKGRIDFASLLRFCFSESPTASDLGSPTTASGSQAPPHTLVGGDDATSGETLSAVSEGLNEQKSVGSSSSNNNYNNNNARRPHTATSTRPVVPDSFYHGQHQWKHGQEGYRERDRDREREREREREIGNRWHHDGYGGASTSANQPGSASKGQRPLTASARVSTNQHEGLRSGASGDHKSIEQHLSSDPHFVLDLADDIIDDDNEEDLMLLTPHSTYNQRQHRYDEGRDHHHNNNSNNNNAFDGIDGHDGASFNDNTLVTDQEEYYFGSPQGNLTTLNSRDMWNSQSLDGLTASQENQLPSVVSLVSSSHHQSTFDPRNHHHHHHHHHHLLNSDDNNNNLSAPHRRQDGFDEDLEQPDEHLQLLAHQTLATVRGVIIGRLQTGRTTLEDVFQHHFDGQAKGFFDAQDFVRASSDLRIEISDRVARFAISQIALDGLDQVSLGEFKVFVTDAEHWELENSIHLQMANLLEKSGRKFQSRLYQVFWEQDEAYEGMKTEAAKTGMVCRDAFLAGLQILRLRLTASEVNRLVTRFDVNGRGNCSVTRFLQMAQSSQAWQNAEKTLALQEEAQEEAAQLRRQIRASGQNATSLSEEVIAMAEYLGIRVISDQHILWIANDALKAPLPINWTAQRDSKKRIFFYNHISNESRWDHPLDPHFRSLRDKYRAGGDYGGIASENSAVPSHAPPPLNIHLHSTSGARPNFPNELRVNTFRNQNAGVLGVSRQQNAARPNSAGALLGHGIARQQAVSSSSDYNSRFLPPPISSLPYSQRGSAGGVGGPNTSNRPRPQSALPERLTAFPSAVPLANGGGQHMMMDRAIVDNVEQPVVDFGVAINDFYSGMRGEREARPSSAPNYLSAGFTSRHSNGTGRIEMPMSSSAAAFATATSFANSGVGAGGYPQDTSAGKKPSTDSIYRAPYFNMAVFNKDGTATLGDSQNQQHGRRKVSSSRDGGGSNHSGGGGNASKKQAPRVQSAVDRAVSYGKVPSYLLPREKERPSSSSSALPPKTNQKLLFMLEGDVLQRLGGVGQRQPERKQVIIQPPPLPTTPTFEESKQASSGPGGIVLLN